MGMQFRKIGTLVLGALAVVALSAPKALAQDQSDTSAPTPAPLPFHLNLDSAVSFDAPSGPTMDLMAQGSSSHHEGFGFGIQGGLLFARFGNSPIDGGAISNKTGTTIGIFFGGNRPGRFGVQGELMYQTRKATAVAAGQDISAHSLEIPVLFRGNIGSQSLKGVLVFILVGPAVDIQLKDSLGSLDVKSDFQTFNIDVIAGGGVEFARFFVEGREDWGLRNVVAGNLGNVVSIKDKTFNLIFGFRIN